MNNCEFILCIGDGKTDEVVFQYLNELENSITATVGIKQTEAEYYLEGVKEVESILLSLCDETIRC